MSKSRVLIPVLAGAAALGAVAYALSRSSKRIQAPEPELRESMVVPRGTLADEYPDLNLEGVFDANPEDALEHATVHADTRAPTLTSGDDAEPPSPEDLGAYWLTRATDSERSHGESDLELDLDGFANPDDAAEFSDEQDEQDEPLVANDTSRS